jgi:hypothetical protein
VRRCVLGKGRPMGTATVRENRREKPEPCRFHPAAPPSDPAPSGKPPRLTAKTAFLPNLRILAKRGYGRGVSGGLARSRKSGVFWRFWRLRQRKRAVFTEGFAKKRHLWAGCGARHAAEPVCRNPNAQRGQPPRHPLTATAWSSTPQTPPF